MSSEKALQQSETETRELLRGTKKNNIFSNEGSLICLIGKLFVKKCQVNALNGIELVTRPGCVQTRPKVLGQAATLS